MTLHQDGVARLLDNDVLLRAGRFAQGIRDELCGEGKMPWEDLKAAADKIRPDAWKIVDGVLYCHEVVETSGMTPKRRAAYGDLHDRIIGWGGDLRLFVHDVRGGSYQADLNEYFQDTLLAIYAAMGKNPH